METELGKRSPDIFTFPPPLILGKKKIKKKIKKRKNRKRNKSRQGKRQKIGAPLAQGLDITGNDKISSAIWCK